MACTEQAPACFACGAVVNERWSAGAAVTVWACDAAARPAAEAVTAMLPGTVPMNQKLAVLAPAAMDTDDTAALQPESE